MLERALGGSGVLIELTDKSGAGVADATFVAEVLAEVDDEANSYITNAVDVGDPAVDTAPLLLAREKICAVYLVWLRGTQSQAMPPAVMQDRADAHQWYQDVGNRKASIGTKIRVAAGQPVKQVTTPGAEQYFRTTDTAVGPAGPRGRFGGWS